MRRKILFISLIVVVIALVSVGTFAWFNAADEVKNVFTIGGVKVEQIEQQRNPSTGELEEFQNGKKLAPVLDNDNPTLDQHFKDKIVTVKNTGKSEAYIQTYVAIPSVLDDAGILHIYDDNALSNGWIKVSDLDEKTDGEQSFLVTKINSISYNVYLYRYTKSISKGDITKPVIEGVYIDSIADRSDDHNFFVVNNVAIEGFDRTGELFVYVCTQAMQSSGFDNYADALVKGFGTGSESLPDFSNVIP